MYKKIIVGIDGSDHSKKALNKAFEIQKRDNADLLIFHSVLHHFSEIRPSLTAMMDVGNTISYEIHSDIVKRANVLMEDINERIKTEGVSAETKLVYDLGPQYFIKDQVKEKGFDLVILGCEGEHNKLKRTLIGTVPEYVINNVDVDVLITK